MPARPLPSEALTRKLLIDEHLRRWGWSIAPFESGVALSSLDRVAVEEFPTAHGPADYALFVGGRILGVIEAKKLTLGPQNVLVQAERYASGITQQGFCWGSFGVPFLYSTNGEVVWFEDVRDEQYRSRLIAGFHTPDALAELLNRDTSAVCAKVLTLPQGNARLREYQGDASRAIEEALLERKRQMLVAMATGTGKANVIFLQKGEPTSEVWIYDGRSNIEGITKKDRPLTRDHFREFEECYGIDPNGRAKRKDLGEEGRFRRLPLSAIKQRDYKLDVTWLKDDSLDENGDLPEPQDLATEAITELEAVVDDLREIIDLLDKEAVEK